ncbi:MAG: DUF6454 family protein [Phenylobacterium sp.]
MRGLLLGLIAALAASPALALPVRGAPSLAERLMAIDRSTAWTPVAAIPVQFPTFHPQGMVRIGGEFFVTSVEVKRAPAADPKQPGGRDAGAGVGHLFRISADGALLADLVLGEGDAYHPGGIDYDGRDIWVPVAEYRPDSRAIIYRVDPRTMAATVVLRAADHIGAVVHDSGTGRLHGVSWGARRFYDWSLSRKGVASAPRVFANRSSYIDYQDCHGLGGGRMLCSGLAGYRGPTPGAPFQLGGWEIVDLADHRPAWQSPIPLWAPSGRAMTQNPSYAEATASGVRAWFMPDDNRSTIYVYDAAVGPR